jgi:hypothetical protein
MPGILFVRGGDDHAGTILRAERRAYWSAALPVVLEKHGYLALDESGPEALEDPVTFDEYDVVLVARLGHDQLGTAFLERVRGGRGGVIAEGPLPPIVENALGVERAAELSPYGALTIADEQLARIASHFGTTPGGALTETSARPITRNPAYDWRSAAPSLLTEDQAAAWGAPAWDVVEWTAKRDPRTLAVWRTRGSASSSPAIVQHGRLVGCSFGLFAFLAQRHTSEPFPPGEHRSADRTLGLEAALLALLDLMYVQCAGVRVRVKPWPNGTTWGLSVRHDVDRPLSLRDARVALRRHAKAGTAATWYWRSANAPSAALTCVGADARHEIALHTERMWGPGGDAERACVEAAVGRRVRGASVHGSPQSFRFQGAPNVLWAEGQGLLYTELIQQGQLHPHRFPVLLADGTIRILDVLCLPHHVSFELTSRGSSHEAERLKASWHQWAKAGGLLQVMNHPDRHPRRLFRFLRTLPSEGRLDCTAEGASDWWRRTHVQGGLRIQPRPGRSVVVVAKAPVHGVVLEFLDGRERRWQRSVDLDASSGVLVT